ncbi:TonB-dependent receptor [Sphingomonas prati]|uniref:Outer membrane receptor protein involved in Fe transport n=1 Tax=Sphingomonas prati TaxID=1843237 RepID=A0A7W9F1G4_9SPHN|nr:TonB-dependent receptor [Sphingomonas prati]MBB5729288.1 outer membrane receptor protein involved in Fe transport [Sphingomonas prati]GGE78608.1 TonB-dependent receptor [Sphingomonas prati]
MIALLRTQLLLGAAMSIATPAPAQQAAETAPPADATTAHSDPNTIGASRGESGEIVVTALKRAATVQTIPIAITALGDKGLANLGATTIADIIRQVPGLQLTESDSGRTRVSIRGVQAAGESTVGLYYGETPLTGPSGVSSDPGGNTPNLNLFDVERVEVLRGPQGTLYGSGSMGGTLRVLFKQPDATRYEGATELQISDTRNGSLGFFAKGAVNVPLIADKLAARAVLYRERSGGFVDYTTLPRSDVNRANFEGGRFMLGLTPNEDISIVGTALIQTQRIGGTSQWTSTLGPYQNDAQVFQPWYDKLQLYNGTGRFDLGFATVTAITSWYKWKVESTNDNVRSYANVISRNTWCPLYTRIQTGVNTTTCNAAQRAAYQDYAQSKQPIGAFQPRFVKNFTNELRVSSNGTGPFSYTVGAFLEDRNDRVDTIVFPGDAATGEQRQPTENLGGRYVTSKVKQTAFFGEGSYRILEPLTATIGLRHYDFKKTVGGEYLGYNFFNGQEPRAYEETTANAKGWVKKFNLDFRLSRNVLLYANAAQGFRPGGANNIPNLPTEYLVYKPDSLWNYEVGVKTSLFDRHATLNVTAYRTDWKDVQTSVSTLQTGGGNFSFIYNLAGVTVEGLEVEATANPFAGLSLNGSFNYNNARLDADQVDDTGFVVAAGLEGDKLTYVPRMTASAGAEYRWPLFGNFEGYARTDYTYTGKMNTELRPTNAFYREVGKFSIVNARVGMETGDFGVFLFVNNVFDELGINRVSSATGVSDTFVSARPRTVGLNMRKSFR